MGRRGRAAHRVWLAHHYAFNADKKTIMGAAVMCAHEHAFHPVREYFDKIEWDRKERLSSWLHEYLGAQANEYARAAGMKFLIGAVARVMRPGCKMDNVLILEGPQGRWKSSALRALAGDWFSDTPFTIGDKDAYLQIRGNLIYELAELDGFSRAESSRGEGVLLFARTTRSCRSTWPGRSRCLASACSRAR
jgi:putative DNA primase/helicase